MAKLKKPIKPYKQGQLFAMQYQMWIGGEQLSLARKQCITSISITETVEGSDSASIKIADPDMVYINDNLYEENRKVKIRMGWSGHTHRITFNGYISAIDIDFPEDGVPTLSIVCMDNTYKMNKKPVNKTYKKKTSAQVVQSICKKYGFKCVIESGYKFTKQDSISQSNQTDIDFITKLAGDEVYPFTARLVGDTFYYVKMGKLKKKPLIDMHYREYPNEILSFSPKINTENKETSSGSTNKSSKKQNTATGSASKDNQNDSTKGDNSKKKTGSSSLSRTYDPVTKTWSSPYKSKKSK